MSLFDYDGLKRLFGAALKPLYRDGTLRKTIEADNGTGGFATGVQDIPVKVLVDSVSDRARASSGLPVSAILLSVLAMDLPVAPDLDDAVIVAGRIYRVVRVDTDPAGAAWSLAAVPG